MNVFEVRTKIYNVNMAKIVIYKKYIPNFKFKY